MPRIIPPEMGNNFVPVLDVGEDQRAFVDGRHDAALDPEDETTLLLGEVVMLDNGRPADGSDGHVIFHIGASTLQEAATEVIGALGAHALDMPEWVASTNDELADVLAEHFTVPGGYNVCKVIDMSEVPA